LGAETKENRALNQKIAELEKEKIKLTNDNKRISAEMATYNNESWVRLQNNIRKLEEILLGLLVVGTPPFFIGLALMTPTVDLTYPWFSLGLAILLTPILAFFAIALVRKRLQDKDKERRLRYLKDTSSLRAITERLLDIDNELIYLNE
jgi:hypothetical protein